MKRILKKIYNIPLISKTYRLIRKLSEKIFVRLFPNSQLQCANRDLHREKAELIELKQQLENENIALKNLIQSHEATIGTCNEKIDVLKEDLNNAEGIYQYLLNRVYKPNKKIKVAFLTFFFEHFDAMESVYRAFANDKMFDTFILVGPRKQFSTKWEHLEESLEYFKNKGIKAISLYDSKSKKWRDIQEFNLDYIFLHFPYEDSFPEKYWCANISKFTRVCYIPYGIIAAKMQQNQFNKDFHHKCFRIFAESPMHKDLFRKYSDIKDRNVVVSGYPKMDIYNNVKDIKNPFSKANNKQVKIIWAPHWAVKGSVDGLEASFLRFYKFFYNLVKERKEIFLLIKPHPGLWPNLWSKGCMSKQEIRNIKKMFNDLPNCEIYEKPGYFPYFIHSDAMIMDSISFMSEYLPTKKPVLFITKDNMHEFNEYGEIILSALYKGWGEDEIQKFIDDVVINKKDTMYDFRMKILNKYIYIPKEGCGNVILNSIKQTHLNERI